MRTPLFFSVLLLSLVLGSFGCSSSSDTGSGSGSGSAGSGDDGGDTGVQGDRCTSCGTDCTASGKGSGCASGFDCVKGTCLQECDGVATVDSCPSPTKCTSVYVNADYCE